jgi:hypothetical protein
MYGRLARLSWVALDRADHAVMVARCWLVDLIYGPQPTTPADEKREADHERLQKAFPGIDVDRTAAVADEELHTPTDATVATPRAVSGRLTEPHSKGPCTRAEPLEQVVDDRT